MYLTRFRYRHAAADAADSAIFAMRNPPASGRVITLEKIVLTVGFDGTNAAAEVGHALCRFSAANPTGGTSPARIKKYNALPASVVLDANIKEGAVLTVAGIVFEGNFHELVIPSISGSAMSHILDFWEPLRLEPGEGIAVRAAIVEVIGATASGSFWWDERQNAP